MSFFPTELKEGFTLFDKNDEGIIPACEIANVLRAIGQTPTEAESEQMSSEASQNGKTGSFMFIAECDEPKTIMVLIICGF